MTAFGLSLRIVHPFCALMCWLLTCRVPLGDLSELREQSETREKSEPLEKSEPSEHSRDSRDA